MAGAVICQQPSLFHDTPEHIELVRLADRYRLVHLHYGSFWTSYILIRRMFRTHPLRELRAWRKGCAGASSISEDRCGSVLRSLDAVALPKNPRVSVVLPTFG